MPTIGPLELVLILIIVILLFGVGRISKISGELGSSIRSFRDGLRSSDKEKKEENKDQPPTEMKE